MSAYLLISDAAKEVKVESHVLRYWEEELHLPIKRNELGHRYYTEEDVERFKQIKGLKERGLQLKAIKMILRDGRLDVLPAEGSEMENGGRQNQMDAELPQNTGGLAIDIAPGRNKETEVAQESKEDKSRRLQWLLQQLIRQTLQENNGELCREIRESVVKELDYQFRMQEEREEARDKMLAERDEEHYKRMDELLRKKSRVNRRIKQEKKNQDKKSQEKSAEKRNQDMPVQEKSLEGFSNMQAASPGKKRRRFLS